MGELSRHLARGRSCRTVLVLAVAIVSAVASWFALRLPAGVGVRCLSWALRLAPGSAWRGRRLYCRHVKRCLWSCCIVMGVGYLVGRRRTLLVRDEVVGWMRDDAVCVFV